MVSEDKLVAKKKKVIKHGPDGVIIKKKKKKKLDKSLADSDTTNKKKKKKKIVDTSILEKSVIFDSDDNLFGSPIKSSTQKDIEPSASESDFMASQESLDLSSAQPQSSPRPVPVMKFAKKTKIKSEKMLEKSPAKKKKLNNSDHEFLDTTHPLEPPSSPTPSSDEEDRVIAAPVIQNTPTDPLISQSEQDSRDLVLLDAVATNFGNLTDDQIDWKQLVVFDMTPQEMSERYKMLSANIPRQIQRSVSDIVKDSQLAFCRTLTYRVPLAKRDYLASRGYYNWDPSRETKKMNAFTLFSKKFDITKVSKDQIKDKWERLEKKEKARLKQDARKHNLEHGIAPDKTKTRKVTGYQEFSTFQLNHGVKMKEIGKLWRELSEEERQYYREKAEETNKGREVPADDNLDDNS